MYLVPLPVLCGVQGTHYFVQQPMWVSAPVHGQRSAPKNNFKISPTRAILHEAATPRSGRQELHDALINPTFASTSLSVRSRAAHYRATRPCLAPNHYIISAEPLNWLPGRQIRQRSFAMLLRRTTSRAVFAYKDALSRSARLLPPPLVAARGKHQNVLPVRYHACRFSVSTVAREQNKAK